MFKDKYPESYALLQIVSTAAKDVAGAVEGGSVLEKVVKFENLIPLALPFLGGISALNAEIKQMSVADYAAAAEELATELAFSNGTAQAVIRAAFPVVDKLAELEPLVVTLVKQIQSAQPVVA